MKSKNINILNRFHIGIKRGVSKALAEHKRLGHSIAVWRNGRIVIIPPQDLVVPPYPDDTEIHD
jgi:hypothetical protein